MTDIPGLQFASHVLEKVPSLPLPSGFSSCLRKLQRYPTPKLLLYAAPVVRSHIGMLGSAVIVYNSMWRVNSWEDWLRRCLRRIHLPLCLSRLNHLIRDFPGPYSYCGVLHSQWQNKKILFCVAPCGQIFQMSSSPSSVVSIHQIAALAPSLSNRALILVLVYSPTSCQHANSSICLLSVSISGASEKGKCWVFSQWICTPDVCSVVLVQSSPC